MALNGLDAQALKEAFDYACSEPGWFLLKYETRDDIVLLGKGASAVKDMRELISSEPDDSPIYGFIRYRRRNILIKLVPDNTSRVLKARSQVHFQSVVERFSPCDVTVSLKSYKELTDAALTTACSTHTATASISSSSSSLRQRRLTDIQETSEEGFETLEAEPKPEPTTTSKVVENQQGLQVIVTTHDPGVSSDGKRAPIEVEISAPEPIKVEQEVEDFRVLDTVDELGLTRTDSLIREREDGGPPRKSTSSTTGRPTAEDIYAELALKYAPKVKLGPRPSADWHKRPHTSSSTGSGPATGDKETSKSGPTASVPKNVHLPARMPTRKARSGSQSSNHSKLQFQFQAPFEATGAVASKRKGSLHHPGPPPPLQFASANNTTTPSNPFPSAPLSPTPSFTSIKSALSTSSHSAAAFYLANPIGAAPAAAAASASSSGISPEKARLMKALELRKKALAATSVTGAGTPAVGTTPHHQPGAEEHQHQQQQDAAEATPKNITTIVPTSSSSTPKPSRSGSTKSTKSTRSVSRSRSKSKSSKAGTTPISTSPHPPATTQIGSTPHASSPDEMSATLTEAGSPPTSSSSSVTPSEPTSLTSSVPDTPTQGTYTATSEPTPVENTLPSPTQAPSTSTEHDSQKSFSDDLDKESESSYGVSDLNGESIESNTITDDGEDRITTRLHPPPPTLLLPTPKSAPPESPKTKENPQPEIISRIIEVKEEPKRDDTPPRSPLLHLNMLHPKTPTDYIDNQTLPKTHNRLPSTEVPVIETARSVSAPFMNNPDKKPVLVASSRKVSVSSSVSQRIKALEMLSKDKPAAASPPVMPPQRSRPSSPTPQFAPVRTNSLKTSTSSPNLSPLVSPGTPRQRIDSPFLLNKKTSDELNGKLQGLPTGTWSPAKARAGSFGEISIVPPRKASIASVSSLNISTIAEPPTFAPKKEDSPPKTADGSPKSKISPLLRRMSSSKAKKTASPITPITPITPPTTTPVSVAPPPPPPPPPPAPIEKKVLLTGWVNVQLPNTMFWKRRYLRIDSDTWLYLTLSADENSPQTGKYNIKNEVMAAMVPDIDEQELPNSVNLRLIEGGVLACACENDQEQTNILKVVRSCIA
ncbi:hypothetical protein TWF788_011394 [Orbilia oligospora]|uniref:ADF-H domain-containing protein n=1 Tax=Orbilia oligospora TaxID=2813651 RepID=A0A7C8KAX1_ORBOL|nr:hypothetical protein TWF788_011394 [Orbilia oligospora]